MPDDPDGYGPGPQQPEELVPNEPKQSPTPDVNQKTDKHKGKDGGASKNGK